MKTRFRFALDAAPNNPLGRKILLAAAWFGLFTGLVEGLVFFTLQRMGRLMGVWTDILWIAMVFDLLVFTTLGLLLALASRLLPRFPWMPLAVFVFSLLAWVNWLGLSLGERIQLFSLIVLVLGLSISWVRLYQSQERRLFKLWRSSLPALAAIAVLAFAFIRGGGWLRERTATAQLPPAAPEAPNVLVIVVDALRADHLSGYGYSRATSPNLDRMIRQGVAFSSAYSTSSYTLPSHASLVTGRYPYQHGSEWHTFQALFGSRQRTIGEGMQALGYRTGAFSGNIFWFSREQGFGRGFLHFEDFFQNGEDMFLRTAYGRMFERFVLQRIGDQDIPARKRAPQTNRALLRWLEQDRSKPFFAFVNYMDVHDPYLAPEPFRSKFSSTAHPGGLLNWRVGRTDPALTPDQLQSEIDGYDASIAYIDDQIGKLIAELHQKGLDDNLLVVITSDHGEAFGEHKLYLHGHSLYQEVIHVPLIFWWPGKIPADLRVDRPVTNAALPSTLMDLLQARGPSFSIPSLAVLWEDPSQAENWPLPLAEIEQQPWVPENYPAGRGWIRSLIGPEYHFIEYENLPNELFRWPVDVREAANLSKRSESQAQMRRFRSLLLAFDAPKYQRTNQSSMISK